MHPVLIFVLLILLVLFISWLKRAPPPLRTKALIYAGLAVLAVLILTGRMHWLMGAIAAGLALFQRVLAATQLFNRLKSMGGPTPGKASDIETRFLRMLLDHDTGEMSGEVLDGVFKGKTLAELSLDDLVALLVECGTQDPQSGAVLESYLDSPVSRRLERACPGERRLQRFN